jgi:hypothetical protein
MDTNEHEFTKQFLHGKTGLVWFAFIHIDSLLLVV